MGIGSGGDGVADMEVGPMDIDHLATKIPLLIGKSCLVAIQTVALLVAGSAVVGIAFGKRPVV